MDDPFEALGLPPEFELDDDRIERAYLARAAAVHPDIAQNTDDAEVHAAALNRARAILRSPEDRANALLRRLGGTTKEEDKALPSAFLMEMMETREAIEEAVTSGDEAARARWQAWAGAQRAEYIKRVGEILARAASDDGAARGEARRQLNAWRYIERLIEQLDPGAARSSGVVG